MGTERLAYCICQDSPEMFPGIALYRVARQTRADSTHRDGGDLWQAKAKEVAARRVDLLTATRKHMRPLASQCQLACLPLRPRVEEQFAFLECAFGAVRTTHRAAPALPIHLRCCLLAYSLSKPLSA